VALAIFSKDSACAALPRSRLASSAASAEARRLGVFFLSCAYASRYSTTGFWPTFFIEEKTLSSSSS
jgi:hypothetical protein